MRISQSGIVLFTEKYREAVEFYEKKVGLRVRERQETLVVFEFGASYLMVETGGVASAQEKGRAMNPTVLRLDIGDFDATIAALGERGLSLSVD